MKGKFASAAEIKVGVVGYGGAFNMGKQHLNEMKAAGMTPAAVCEIDQARLEIAKTEFPGIATYTSLDEMLKNKELNLVVLITPHNIHASQALQCLEAGKSVVCEKPLAITTEECDAMIAAAKKNGLVVSTYHNRHWDPGILTAMKFIQEGRIGKVYKIEAQMGSWGKPGDWWRSSKTISGGILYDWGVHILEYSLQMLGDAKLTEVSGFAHKGYWNGQVKWGADSNEDEGYLVARFDKGQWVRLCITALDMSQRPGWLTVCGTEGSLCMEPGSCKLTTKKDNVLITEDVQGVKGEQEKFYKNVAAHLVSGEPLVITGEWSRRPIHILDLACKSAEQGKALPAKYA